MFLNSGKFGILGMSISGSWQFGAILLIWLCWSPLTGGQDSITDFITDPVEVQSLRDIKERLVDVNKNLSNWNKGDPCSTNWTGVLCFNSPMDDGYLHVRHLQLLNMNLSGTLSPSLGNFSYMKILDFMWNNISGSIPKEIGDIKSLELLILNGNQLTGSLPDELGYLPNLLMMQIDENHISGPIPTSFANLNKTIHFHMNNNSISGQIPPELSRLPSLVHFLLDNNNLSGYIPSELSKLPKILIIQLDNNNFQGTTIPQSFGNISTLLKLSLRNCSLEGLLPDFSAIPNFGYLDLSNNQLSGPIPRDKLSENITTIYLSNNNLNGTIPSYFSGLPHLQKLSLANNSLSGSVPSVIWQNRTTSERLILDFAHNKLTNVSGSTNLPQNVTLWLQGNPACSNSSLVQFCGTPKEDMNDQDVINATVFNVSCPFPYEYPPKSLVPYFCAAPLLIGYRLKSPGFSDFPPYRMAFEQYLTNELQLNLSQLELDYFMWEVGPRLRMNLKLFPVFEASKNNSNIFNKSEVQRIMGIFTGWTMQLNEIFGPYELIDINLLDPYKDIIATTSASSSSISKGALAGIILGAIAVAVALSAIVSLVILRRGLKNLQPFPKRRRPSKASTRIAGVRAFTYAEMALATNNFSSSNEVGQGGYGKVYQGILADGTAVAIKRAQEGSLQGEKEFLTEIELLSRLHHRNLVSLVGYCDEEGEQMLIYEFMDKGTIRDHISVRAKDPPSFTRRLRIALASAKGVLYLHTEADPPIFHRDIKASNILLDSKFNAKVADFGLSRLAPVPETEGTVTSHVSTAVKGTPGYLDPEYFYTHKLTDKSDVYSLGVVFLELLTGMQPISHGKNIVREVTLAYQSGMIFSVIDGRMGSYPSECVEKFLNLALRCCADETESRPSMAEVVRELENIWLMIPESDTKSKDSIPTDPEKEVTPPSSSSTMKNLYLSSDVSRSDLVSGAFPTINPR